MVELTTDPQGVQGLAPAVWTFLFRYFRQINILRFILYSVILCNLSQIDNEVFFFACGFFPQEFLCRSCVFPLFRIFYCVIDHKRLPNH